MAQTTYTKVLPNLTQETRTKVYEGLSCLLLHLPHMGLDLISISVDVPTKTVTLILSNPVTVRELEHFGMD
jgi:hypothetical protein